MACLTIRLLSCIINALYKAHFSFIISKTTTIRKVNDMIKLIALDLDGTLLKKDHTIDLETLTFLNSLQNAAYMVATGRSIPFTEDILSRYKLDCDLLLNNGHEFISRDKKTVLHYPFQPKVLHEVVSVFLEYSCEFFMYDDKGDKYTFTPLDELYDNHMTFSKRHHGNIVVHLTDDVLFSKEGYLRRTTLLNSIDEMQGMNILKIDAMATSKEITEQTIEALAKIPDISISSSYNALIEVCDTSMNKGMMLEKATKMYGISMDEVATFGDGDNDIDMLVMTRYSFAMGNASDKVKNSAKSITDTNENQGILKALMQLAQEGLLS